ncbi:MAG: acyl-phosphate glycerol 3-phosphate acyltransferase [Firmicutes bacterium HGW-Firmicutes-21]|nr:MAG: acyl-phosphate glycerol 3-phosphate acyltransferase [Firmicutes bacterium HGW-Firmicutes-21]
MIYLFGRDGFRGLMGLLGQYQEDEVFKVGVFLILGILLCVAVPYLLGSFNTSIIASKYLYNDDIRKHGSGNAGLTNMYRTYGKKGALYTLAGDILKQVISVLFGVAIMGINGAFLAGTFCMIGHIAPVFYRFKGGKGVLTAATMILIIDPLNFLVLFAVFALIVLIFRYISLGSMMAGFIYPALVFYRDKILYDRVPDFPSMLFSVFIGILIIFMHRENMRRIYHNEENRFSFRKKPAIEENTSDDDTDAEEQK